MKTDFSHLEEFRMPDHPTHASRRGHLFGTFAIRRGSSTVYVIAEQAHPIAAFEHVSAHVREANGKMRVPSWAEMCWIKDLFWNDEETVVQYHVPRAEWVNTHPHVLHLWKPIDALPRPPIFAV